MTTPTVDQLLRENEDLRRRLVEVEDPLRALRDGEADALFVEGGREQVYTLESADQPYWLLVAQLPHAAATLTADGTIISCNHRFADLILRPRPSLAGKPMGDFVARDSVPFFDTLLRDGLAAEAQGEVIVQRGDGAQVAVYLGVSALREGAFGLCLMVTDLTAQRHYQELQRTQEALRASEAQLRDADRRKDEFLATLAHELRNPLAPIRNAVDILKAKGPPHPEMQWCQEVLDRQVRLMVRLLEDLLDVSRISRNALELRTERVELAAVVEAALETSRPVIEACGHDLTVSLPSEPIYLEADPVRLAQVLANLLNNAARYTENGGRIWLSAERQGDEVTVSVKDNGMGIIAEMLPYIFEIFTQSKRAQVRSPDGLGIGLSLVKGLVELHGGSVQVRSDGAGCGSEFLVRLPVAVETLNREPAPPSEDDAHKIAPRRILIVDDNRDGADSLAILLKIMGNEVSTAYDGEHAFEVARALRPDVVLLDIGMPILDGYGACRRIREQPWGREMFLIALTGWGQEEDRQRAEEAGFNQHMVKPVDAAVLMKILGSLSPGQAGQQIKH